jgi:hypothetical protein
MSDSILIQQANKAAEEYRDSHPQVDAQHRVRAHRCVLGEYQVAPPPTPGAELKR